MLDKNFFAVSFIYLLVVFVWISVCLNIQFSLARPSADVGALQTAVMVDVWQREYSLLSQVMSHSLIFEKERKTEEKKYSKKGILTTFAGYVPLPDI